MTMDSKTCDVKTCEATMLATEATVIRIGDKEYDLCKDCAAIFSKWLEETFISGRNVTPVTPWIITTTPNGSGTSDSVPLYWPAQPNTVPMNPYPTYPQITWTATDPKDMNSNWYNCNISYNKE
jgi:hypothetical protein